MKHSDISCYHKKTVPSELDSRYSHFLSNGYYNYQEYINFLASKAQDGDSRALEACMYYFGWRGAGRSQEILEQYYKVLIYGVVDIYNTQHLAFLRLFSRPEEREVLKGKRTSHRKAYLANDKINELSERLNSYLSKDEIYSALVDILLNLILNYNPGERTLRKYIYEIYYLYIADWVQSIFRQRDFLKYQDFWENYDIELIPSYSDYLVIDNTEDIYYNYERKINTLGVYWLAGHTHPLFHNLTKRERLFIRDIYYLNGSNKLLESRYKISRGVISRTRLSAVKKIKENYKYIEPSFYERKGYQILLD